MDEDNIVPGNYVTPPCEGRYRHVLCEWLPTKLCGVHWLCAECEKVYQAHLMVRRVKAKMRAQKRRVTWRANSNRGQNES